MRSRNWGDKEEHHYLCGLGTCKKSNHQFEEVSCSNIQLRLGTVRIISLVIILVRQCYQRITILFLLSYYRFSAAWSASDSSTKATVEVPTLLDDARIRQSEIQNTVGVSLSTFIAKCCQNITTATTCLGQCSFCYSQLKQQQVLMSRQDL